MSETIVVLDDNLNILSVYKCKNREIVHTFVTLVGFMGIDKYYLIPKQLTQTP